MSSQVKQTFYPNDEVENELKTIARGKLSERVNELILKGLDLERREDLARTYEAYDQALEKAAGSNKSSSEEFMSEQAFAAEDEVEDFV